MKEAPRYDPHISKQELDYIESSIGNQPDEVKILFFNFFYEEISKSKDFFIYIYLKLRFFTSKYCKNQKKKN